MSRFARVAIVDEPYHITHRGNHRADIFFTPEHRDIYLVMLAESCARFELDVWAWCLMTNHIQLVAVPRRKTAMAQGVGRAHMRYSRWINSERGWTGHLWANRFHSSLLDSDHLWCAVRYVEQNPVRAGLVRRCEEWPWSSARSHCGLGNGPDQFLTRNDPFPGSCPDWAAWINNLLPEEMCALLRENTLTGRPTGSEEFVREWELKLERD